MVVSKGPHGRARMRGHWRRLLDTTGGRYYDRYWRALLAGATGGPSGRRDLAHACPS